MNIRIIFLGIGILLLTECGSKNDLLYSSATENNDLLLLNDSTLSTQNLLRDTALIQSILHSNRHTDIKTLKTKTKVYAEVKGEESKKINFSMETRILKDSIFWCSMTYFGIEIVRLKATKQNFLIKIIGENNSFPLYQLIEKQYDSALARIQKRAIEKKQDIATQIADLEKMKMMLEYIKNNQREIFMFMNLCFLGEFPFSKIPSDSLWYNDLTGQYTLSYPFQKGKMTAIFNKNNVSYMLNKLFMKQGKMYFGVTYVEYQPLGNNTFLPQTFIAFNDMVDDKNQHQILQLRFENNSIKLNTALEFPMPDMK